MGGGRSERGDTGNDWKRRAGTLIWPRRKKKGEGEIGIWFVAGPEENADGCGAKSKRITHG